MITRSKESKYLEILDNEFDVQDVYFHKGILYVVNAYDIPAVEDFMDTVEDCFSYQYVEEDTYAY